MATPTTTSRINSNYGITYGFTDNSGLTIGESFFPITNALGTSSIAGTVSIYPTTQNTYVNIIPSANAGGSNTTNTIQLYVGATSSFICDTIQIMITGPVAGTTSVVYNGNIKGDSATNNIAAGKFGLYTGIYNGTAFVGKFTGTV
jgi:hypothetical protein